MRVAPMNRRQLAHLILALRRLIIAGLIARLREDRPAERLVGDEFTKLANRLPLRATLHGGLERYISHPAGRKIDREGLLAQTQNGMDL